MRATRGTGSDPTNDIQPMTRKDWADHRLRTAILDGSYPPGHPLVISTLAAEIGLSPTPLREALQRLSSEGLVELVSHGSARVASVGLAEATEIYELRELLEPMAIESAIAHSDDPYRAAVRDAFKSLGGSEGRNHPTHEDFHRSLRATCASGWLTRVVDLLADRARLIITTSWPALDADYDLAEAHRDLADACLDGDATGAAEELRRHLGRTVERLADTLAEQPDVDMGVD